MTIKTYCWKKIIQDNHSDVRNHLGPWISGNTSKLELLTSFITFGLAMSSPTLSYQIYTIFCKVNSTVAPFLNSLMTLDCSTMPGYRQVLVFLSRLIHCQWTSYFCNICCWMPDSFRTWRRFQRTSHLLLLANFAMDAIL